jgi:hypothetical protein
LPLSQVSMLKQCLGLLYVCSLSKNCADENCRFQMGGIWRIRDELKLKYL